MQKSNQMGMNRTGVDMSPIHSRRMLQDLDVMPPGQTDQRELQDLERQYISEADPVGSVPMPGTLKGVLKTTMEKLSGANPEVLINKLGERLAFERTGTRLYDQLILKFQAHFDSTVSPSFSLEELRDFRQDEADHFLMVKRAMEQLGADPTAMTPDADVSGVASQGLMHVLSDPRSSLTQCLEAILTAELSDNAGWVLLITLCNEMKLDDLASEFEEALSQEQYHLMRINEWHNQMVMMEAGVAS